MRLALARPALSPLVRTVHYAAVPLTARPARLALAAVVTLVAGCPMGSPPPVDDELRPFATGSLPNDVALTTCDGKSSALVLASGDARLDVHALPSGDVQVGAFFAPDADSRAATPWNVDVNADGSRALATLFGQDAVALLEPCTGAVLDVLDAFPADESARTPQPVLVDGAFGFVAFTNIESFSTSPDEPPVLGAGRVLALDFSSDALVVAGDVTLPCLNPQGLASAGSDGARTRIVASCSGALGPGVDGGQVAVGDGALVIIDVALDGSLSVAGTIGAARFAPGTPAVLGGDDDVVGNEVVVAGSLVDPLVLAAPLVDGAELAVALTLDGPDAEAAFEVARWDDDTALVVQFTRDSIHAVDVDLAALAGGARADETVSLRQTISVGPGSTPGSLFRGALAIDVDRAGSTRAPCIDAIALLGLSAEAVPLCLANELDDTIDDERADDAK